MIISYSSLLFHAMVMHYCNVILLLLVAVTANLAVSFKERSMVVRESSSDPALLCIQICPAERNLTGRDIANGEQQRFEITTIPGSADGNMQTVHPHVCNGGCVDIVRS